MYLYKMCIGREGIQMFVRAYVYCTMYLSYLMTRYMRRWSWLTLLSSYRVENHQENKLMYNWLGDTCLLSTQLTEHRELILA